MFNLFTQQEERFKNINSDEFQSILESSNGENPFEILDVRTPAEYSNGHIPGAKLLNLMDPEFRSKLRDLNPETTYYVYCRSGSRSLTACALMAETGIKDLFNLRYGLMGWSGPLE